MKFRFAAISFGRERVGGKRKEKKELGAGKAVFLVIQIGIFFGRILAQRARLWSDGGIGKRNPRGERGEPWSNVGKRAQNLGWIFG